MHKLTWEVDNYNHRCRVTKGSKSQFVKTDDRLKSVKYYLMLKNIIGSGHGTR